MIGGLVEWATRARGVVLLLLALLVAGGGYALYSLPMEAVPDITGVQVQVNTPVPAESPAFIEQRVTIPLERAMMGVPGMTTMRSLTKFGLSQLTLEFKDGTDDVRARTLVTERLQQVSGTLAPGVQPTMTPISPGLGEILYYTLDWAPGAKTRPADPQEALAQLYETQEYGVKIALRKVNGVAEINSNGGLEAQYLIQPRPDRLAASGMTFDELASAIGENVEDTGGGMISRGAGRLTVHTSGRVENVPEIAKLPVKFAAGIRPMTVGDLATVDMGSRIRMGAASSNGQQVVLGTVMMLVGANSRDVANQVTAALPGIRQSLPPGMRLNVLYSRATLVDATIGTVKENLSIGALLVCIVLVVVLGSWRAALLVAIVIPTAFVFAVGGMRIAGVSGNLMSLGALDFGMIVDGAIVIVENSLRLMTQRRADKGGDLDPEERRVAVVDAARQVVGPMVFGVVIITLIYVPVLSLTGVEGKTFHPMAITVMLALIGALLLALTVVPALTAWLLRPTGRVGEHDGESWVIRRATAIYRPALDFALAHTGLLAGVALLLAIGAGFLFSRLGAEFVPKLDEGSIATMVYKPVNMSLADSLATELKTERVIKQRFPAVTTTFSRIGTSEVATDPMPPNQNDLYIFYKPTDQWPKGDGQPKDKPALVKAIQDVLDKQVPGQTFEFSQPIETRFNEMLQGTRSDVSVKIFGEDFDMLDKLTGKVAAALGKAPGADSVERETHGRVDTLVIDIDRNALLRYNLSIAAVNSAVNAALAGRTVGSIYEEDRRHDVVVRMTEPERASDAAIMQLPIRVGTDGMIPLGRVASLKVVKTTDPIMRDDSVRRTALMVSLGQNDVETFITDAKERLARQVKMPEGYRVEFQGQFQNLETARARLLIVVPAALAFIFVLVFFALGSWRQAGIVFTGIPFAVTGGVYALALRGMPFSITAAIGFIALLGVAMLNGLVLLSHFNMLRRDGQKLDDAVRHGSLDRLRPVLATALVASIGFIPMAIATGPGAEVQRPLATVVIGGIITSTILTLLLLPSLYRLVAGRDHSEPPDHDTAQGSAR